MSLKNNSKYIWLVLVGILILANMVLITSFSLESREDSGNRSHSVTEQVVIIIQPEYPQMSPDEQATTIEKFHLPIRKLAHFTEFCLLGMLTATFVHILGKGRYWLWWIIPSGICLLYAIFDEVLQIYTSRGSSPKDVGIDFLGSLTGILLVHLIGRIYRKYRHRRKAKNT